MKLKEVNDALQKVVDDTLSQLSTAYSKQTQEEYIFKLWSGVNQLDKDKNLCYAAVIDVRREVDGKVDSFKTLYDKWIVQRPNIGTLEKPKYGKQLNVEESRNTVLREIIAKSIAGMLMALSQQTKEQIEEFNQIANQEQ
jgi:hypothetical protein